MNSYFAYASIPSEILEVSNTPGFDLLGETSVATCCEGGMGHFSTNEKPRLPKLRKVAALLSPEVKEPNQ